MRATGTVFLSLIFVALGITSSHADGFSRDSIFSKEWICISPEQKSEGPIADRRIGKIFFKSLISSKTGNQTTIKISSAEIAVDKASWSGLNLFFAFKNKTYAQKLIKFKDASTEMTIKLKFSGTVPTKIARDVYFGVNLQSDGGGAPCIKKSEYEKMLPANYQDSGSKTIADPVIQKITERIRELPSATVPREAPVIEWYLQDSSYESFQRDLMMQHQDLANVYPELYSWEIPAIAIVGDLLKWRPPSSSFSTACNEGITGLISMWKTQPHLDDRLLAATWPCDGRIIALFRPHPKVPKPNGDLMAQELGVEIQNNSILMNRDIPQGLVQSGKFAAPIWYFQGGQTALAYRTHAQVKKTLVGSFSMATVTPDCVDVPLEKLHSEQVSSGLPTNCTYTKGFAAHQVLIALYGWEAILSWYSGFDQSNNYEAAFLKTFKEPIQNFNTLVDEYWDYLNEPSKYPKLLSARLAK